LATPAFLLADLQLHLVNIDRRLPFESGFRLPPPGLRSDGQVGFRLQHQWSESEVAGERPSRTNVVTAAAAAARSVPAHRRPCSCEPADELARSDSAEFL